MVGIDDDDKIMAGIKKLLTETMGWTANHIRPDFFMIAGAEGKNQGKPADFPVIRLNTVVDRFLL